MKKQKVIYIISDIDKALAFEWAALGLREKFDLIFVLIGKQDSIFSLFLKKNAIRFYEISDDLYSTKLKKWLRLYSILKKEKPDTVHTHLWIANLLGLSSAWVLRIKQRIYTRHHALTHYLQFPSGRKWDLLCNYLATHMVAISNNTKQILLERDKAAPDKISLIHHGFDFDYFRSVSPDRVAFLRERYNIPNNSGPVVGVISRYQQWKGIQYIIPAFQKVREKYPEAKLILA